MSKLNVENKRMVKEFYDRIYGATPETIEAIAREYYTVDTIFDCAHPINRLEGVKDVVEQFWKPFLHSFPDVIKRPYIFMGGRSIRGDEAPQFVDADWVCATGYYEATFAEDFLDIPASNGIVFLRFCECTQIVDGKIVCTRMLFDFLDLMRQVGIRFFQALGNESFIPGPVSFDGIMMSEYDEATGAASIKLIEDMCFKGLNAFEEGSYEGMGLRAYFKEDFTWYGPGGIGVCKGMDGFEKYHQIPWLNSLPDRRNANFFASIGEANYAFVGGWPSMYATHLGSDWLGVPATGVKLEMRCIDWWRVENGKIVENWVNLDVIHMLYQMGVDIFQRIRDKRYYFSK